MRDGKKKGSTGLLHVVSISAEKKFNSYAAKSAKTKKVKAECCCGEKMWQERNILALVRTLGEWALCSVFCTLLCRLCSVLCASEDCAAQDSTLY